MSTSPCTSIFACMLTAYQHECIGELGLGNNQGTGEFAFPLGNCCRTVAMGAPCRCRYCCKCTHVWTGACVNTPVCEMSGGVVQPDSLAPLPAILVC